MKKGAFFALLALLLCCFFPVAFAEEEAEPTPTPEPTPRVYSVEPNALETKEQSLVSRDGVEITVKSLEFGGFYGPELHLLLENKNEEEISVDVTGSSINGIMVRTVFSCDIMPGKKANAVLSFMQEDLQRAQITYLSDIDLRFHVYNTQSWETLFRSDPVRLETNMDEDFEQIIDDGGLLLVDKKKVRVVAQRLVDDETYGTLLRVFIENKSDMNITVTTQDTSLNGYMMDPFFSCEVLAGKSAYGDIVFLESDIENNDISRLQSMETVFHIYETSTWYTLAHTDPVTIDFGAMAQAG